jgi:hypothetical protein
LRVEAALYGGTQLRTLKKFQGHTTNRAMATELHQKQGQAEEVVVMGVVEKPRQQTLTALLRPLHLIVTRVTSDAALVVVSLRSFDCSVNACSCF